MMPKDVSNPGKPLGAYIYSRSFSSCAWGEWSVTEESSLISLSFPEIDKSRFRQLRLHFHICGVSALGNVILRMNQVSSGQYDTGGINRTDGLYLSFTSSLFAAGFAEWFFIPGAADRLPAMFGTVPRRS